jgi:hypothetical protein
MRKKTSQSNFHRAIFKRRTHFSGSKVKERAGYVDGPFSREKELGEWVVENLAGISPKTALIGAQIKLGNGGIEPNNEGINNEGIIDVLGLLPSANFCIIELKRDAAQIADVMQLIEYSRMVDELVLADLDRLLNHRAKRSLTEFYSKHFNADFPPKRPRTPTLILLAADIPPDVESLLLFLNQRHGFNFQAISYLSPGSQPGEPKLDPTTVIVPGDQLSAPGPMPAPLYTIRYREEIQGHWDTARANRLLVCPDSNELENLYNAITESSVTLLIYLEKAGYVGLAHVGKNGAAWQTQPGGNKTLALKVRLEFDLSRERALFYSEAWQPTAPIALFTDEELWGAITSRLRFRAGSSRRFASHGAERRPYQRPKPRPGTSATPASAE